MILLFDASGFIIFAGAPHFKILPHCPFSHCLKHCSHPLPAQPLYMSLCAPYYTSAGVLADHVASSRTYVVEPVRVAVLVTVGGAEVIVDRTVTVIVAET